MTLPSSGPISLNALATEYGVANTTPLASYIGKPGGPTGNPVSLTAFYGLSNVAFTPDGGPVTNTAAFLASATLACNLSAVWTYSVTSGGTAVSVSLASGASGTSIQFQQGVTGLSPNRVGHTTTWGVQGVSNGVTRNFTVTLTTQGD